MLIHTLHCTWPKIERRRSHGDVKFSPTITSSQLASEQKPLLSQNFLNKRKIVSDLRRGRRQRKDEEGREGERAKRFSDICNCILRLHNAAIPATRTRYFPFTKNI